MPSESPHSNQTANDATAPPPPRELSTSHSSSAVAESSTPRVSIIMPAYNVAAYIGETLASVFAQTFGDYEIIVVNDGSPDTPELERVLAPYRERIIYVTQENRGLSGARNTALKVARGEFIALLDSDDVWEPNYLEVQIAALDADPTIDVLYPNALIFGASRLAGRRYMDEFPSHGEVTFESLCLKKCSVLIFVTARREAILRAGMFDESLRSCEDFDLWLRILKGGGRIAYHRQVLARYRRRDDSLSANALGMYSYKKQILDKVERTMKLTRAEQRAVEFLREQVQANLNLHAGKKAFFEGDMKTARAALRSANEHFKSFKLGAVIKLLSLAPQTLRRFYDLRDRHFYKADTKI